MIGPWRLLGTRRDWRPGKGSWCLQSGHQPHCRKHRSGPCTWSPDEAQKRGEKVRGCQISYQNYCSRLHLGKISRQHLCTYSKDYTGTKKIKLYFFLISPRQCKTEGETFEKSSQTTRTYFKVCITVSKSFTRLRKWDKFPVMAPGRLEPPRLRQFHVI